MKIRRNLSIFVCLALIITVVQINSIKVSAATDEYNLWVSGVKVTDNNKGGWHSFMY